MTRLEEALRANCRGIDLDLLNFGIGGASVWDYKILFDLAGPTLDPDLVLVNLYLGNDGPDLFARPPSLRGVPQSLRKFYLARYVINLVRVATALERHVATGTSRSQWTPPPSARGGHMVNSDAPIQPHDSRLVGPIYTPESFVAVMWNEYRRFARPPGAPSVQRTWGPTLSILDLLRHQVTGQGRRMVLSLYPSVLQVDPRDSGAARGRIPAASGRDRPGADRSRPPAAEPCRARVLPRLGARLLRPNNGSRREQPTIERTTLQGPRHALDGPGKSRRGGGSGSLASPVRVSRGAARNWFQARSRLSARGSVRAASRANRVRLSSENNEAPLNPRASTWLRGWTCRMLLGAGDVLIDLITR